MAIPAPGPTAGRKPIACLANVPNEPTELELPVLYPNYEHRGGGFVPLEQLNLTSDTATQPWQSQLGHLTVTAVEPTTEPATHDFLE